MFFAYQTAPFTAKFSVPNVVKSNTSLLSINICLSILDLFSITITKSFTTPMYSGRPVFPVCLLDEVDNAFCISTIELFSGSKAFSKFASLINSHTHKSVFLSTITAYLSLLCYIYLFYLPLSFYIYHLLYTLYYSRVFVLSL